jgi:hypothetical protein
MCFLRGSCRLLIQKISVENKGQPCVEAGSNTSTVTLRVVGGDKKGSLKSEALKYGPSPKGLGPKKDYAGECQQHTQKTDPSSRQRERPTKTGP